MQNFRVAKTPSPLLLKVKVTETSWVKKNKEVGTRETYSRKERGKKNLFPL